MNMTLKPLGVFLAGLSLAVSIFPGTGAWAQEVASAGQPHSLYITILDGEGALNDIRERTAREPIVQIQDENHKPVAGALVLFSVDSPSSGSPLATFAGAQSVSVETDANGTAAGKGFQIGSQRGQFTVHVRASKGQTVAEASIVETNVAAMLSSSHPQPSGRVGIFSNKKLDWVLGGAVAGGIAAGLVIALSGHQTTITPGTGTVGAPAVTPGLSLTFGRH